MRGRNFRTLRSDLFDQVTLMKINARGPRCIRCRRYAPASGLCSACKQAEDREYKRAADLEAYRSKLPPSLPQFVTPVPTADTLIDMLRGYARSTASLDDYITAAIAAGLLGDPGYNPVALDDICLAAPQYLVADVSTRASVLERATRDGRELRARSAQERIGCSPFTAPRRWVPTDD